MSADITVTTHDHIQRIHMNRPAKKNALTRAMYEAMTDAILRAEQDDNLTVIVFSGVEGSFTAGNDLGDFLHHPPTGEDSPVIQFIRAISRATKPMIAAVDGLAVGIGTTMLLHCDFVYASPRTRFILPFINLALVPEAGSSLLLPRLAGHQRACDMLMLGEPFSAETGREIGLVNQVCAPEELEAKAMATAQKLGDMPRKALIATKALLRRDPEPLEQRIQEELVKFGQFMHAAEAREAFAAFLQKRKPDFKSIET